MLRAMPRSAASERDDGSRVPGASRPVRTASRRASVSPARSPGPVSSRCAAYAIGFLAALLTLGSLSDRIGRRPVLIGALVVQLARTSCSSSPPASGG